MARPGGFGRGLLGGLGGFMLGGLLGGLLFGGLGSGSGLGFGLFDLLLIGGGVFLLMAWMRRRREATVAPAPAYATAGGGTWAGGGTATAQPVDTLPEMPAALADLDRGVGHIRQMDPAFDPAALAASARTVFGQVQAAIGARDVAPLRDRIGPELFGVLKTQCDALRGGRRVNRVEGIDIREADVTEAWQESGRDYATVRLAGSLIDYTADEATGEVVKGSRSAQAFEEYWTFSRPVGPNRWVLGAIQTG
jgi:predicted lipid-binding transport protein (Tim44 family)